MHPNNPNNRPVPPLVEPFAFAKSLHRGQRYNIMCMVTRGDLPVSIRWFKDGQPLESAGFPMGLPTSAADEQQLLSGADSLATIQQPALGRKFAERPEGQYGLAVKQLDPYSSTLTFASLQSHHRGLYACEATNEVGRANQSSALVIHGECLRRWNWKTIELRLEPSKSS